MEYCSHTNKEGGRSIDHGLTDKHHQSGLFVLLSSLERDLRLPSGGGTSMLSKQVKKSVDDYELSTDAENRPKCN